MIVIYTPKDAEGAEYDSEELACSEADAVSRATELQWAQMGQALRQQSPAAMRAVAWAWRKRAEPTLRLSQFDPPLKSLKARFSTDEIPDFLRVVARSSFTPEQREQVYREVVDLALEPAEAERLVAEARDPKASPDQDENSPSPSSEPSTNS